MNKHRLLAIVLLCMPSLYGMHNNNYDSLKNLFLSTLNRWVAGPLYQSFFPIYNHQAHEDACAEYQKLGKRAYDRLEVSLDERVSIKNMKNFPDDIKKNMVGLATPHAIFIKEEDLDKHPYSVKKHVLLHEVAHVKYYDNVGPVLVVSGGIASLGVSMGALVGSTGFLLSSIKYPQNLKRAFKGILTAGATGSLGTISIKYVLPYQKYLRESRADQTAIHALNCYKCVDEVKKVSGHQDASKGYWSAEQMQKVADKFKQQNKLCPDHK